MFINELRMYDNVSFLHKKNKCKKNGMDEKLTTKSSQLTLKTFGVLFVIDELIDGNCYELTVCGLTEG